MDDLIQAKCDVCRIGAPPATKEEIKNLMPQIPEWNIVTRDGINRLERIYIFDNFVDALSFTNQVGDLAESEGHHPALLTEWGKVTVTWWTHKIKALHRNDFIMAAKTDQILSSDKYK